MSREEYLKSVVKNKMGTLQSLSNETGIAYSTLSDMMKNVGSARVDNVIKVCSALNITIQQLQEFDLSPSEINLNEQEEKIILSYRNQSDDVKNAIAKMLDVDLSSNLQPTLIFRAAKSNDNHEPEIIQTTKDFSKIKTSNIKI